MQDLKNRILLGERAAIAKAITIVESSREEDITRGNLVKIENWFLTPTEANLYALFYVCLSPDAPSR